MKFSISIFILFSTLLQADIKSTSGEINFFSQPNSTPSAKLNTTGLSLGNFEPSANLHVKGNVILESGNVWLGNSYRKSTIEHAGSFGQNFGSINSDTTLTESDNYSLYLIDTSSSNIYLTLPFAGNVQGRQYQFKKTSANNFIRIISQENIEGLDSSLDLSSPTKGLSSIKIMSQGTEWFVLDSSDDLNTVVASDNLVGWWKLDETTGTTAFDSSGQSNHGTIGGDGVSFSDNNIVGRLQGGLNMSTKNNYIDVSSFNGLPAKQISVSCWAYLTEHQNWSRFVNHEWVNNGWLLYCGVNGDLRFGIGQGGAQSNATAPTKTFPLNQWVFITGTYDGSNVKVFINGSELASTALSNATLDNVGDVNISKSSSINGMIDDIRIYSRGLTQTEILVLYREGLH